ncbi:hypothetical protein LXL04_018304 [Taraxacum kok-saghyz]
MSSKTTAARKHVEKIRRTKFSIGGKSNPLTEDLHQAVKNLSAELYAKDVHFLMELIQNAEDNEYLKKVEPTLEFVITSKDITNTGAPATLLVFNNEKGFLANNIESICSVGRSTKKGLRKLGYIGEKGIGFKSVFLITSQPHIFSNGYHIKFNEKPCQQSNNLGYIVPQWVDNDIPMLSAIETIYGSPTPLPTTTLVLPLKPEKVKPVKDQLSSIHPEVLLFLSKIRRLSVREVNEHPNLNAVTAISISTHGIYSYLPTETVTNFPFVIQADFLLASSRENILWDNKWNQGILDCVDVAFVNAFNSLVKSVENAPVSSLPNMFRFLPVNPSCYSKLNNVRDAIKARIRNEAIIPCESYGSQKKVLFCKPNEAGRVKPAFWSILNKASKQGASFVNVSSHGTYPIASSFDKSEYNHILNFLDIKFVDNAWYAKCIRSSNLVTGVSEDVYIQLLVFIAENWDSFGSYYLNTDILYTPLIKYVGRDGNVALDTLEVVKKDKILAADSKNYIPWLLKWNTELGYCYKFLPKVTQEAIHSCGKKLMLEKWLKVVGSVDFVSVSRYASHLLESDSSSVYRNRQLAINYANFLHKSLQKKYLEEHEVIDLCRKMPIVDKYGKVVTKSGSQEVLVPAKGSKWVELIGSNPSIHHNYIELSEDYANGELVSFLGKYVGVSDVPYLSPPNGVIHTLSSPLGKKNTFLLLDWLHYITTHGIQIPEAFLSSVKNNSWLKTSLGNGGAPSESFMLEDASILKNGSMLVEIPLVDLKFYGEKLKNYKDELRMIGVRFENGEACEYIGDKLKKSSKFTKDNFISILKFVKYLRANYISPADFIKSIKGEKWVKTSQGFMTPNNSVLFSQEWSAASEISSIPIIDPNYYDFQLQSFKEELEPLGVGVKFSNQSYKVVLENLKSDQWRIQDNKIVQVVKNNKSLKTNLGHRLPSQCFLLNPESQLLQIFGSFPSLDEKFYGKSTVSMLTELRKIGVMVDFEDAMKEFTRVFKQHVSLSSIKKEHVLSFLQSYRKLKKLDVKFSVDFQNCICKEKWLMTRLGDYKSPNECILFGTEWGPISISPICPLPFIDDNYYGNMIHGYRVELKDLGVVTDFKDGGKFVAIGLSLPQEPNILTPAIVYGLLESIKKEKKTEILDKFREKLSGKKWLKTYFGYKCPHECLLFDSSRDSFLKRSDGPFIDEGFYGASIVVYRDELEFLGVIADDTSKECRACGGSKTRCITQPARFELWTSHRETRVLTTPTNDHLRIYNYLCEFKWQPVDEDDKKWIWIPKGVGTGEWVRPEDCVIRDNYKLFGERMHVLENFKYDSEILGFFGKTLNVKVYPSVEDCCKLWKTWEKSSGRRITHDECCAFWEFVVRNWYLKTENTFTNNLLKLPVFDPTSNRIVLVDKRDVLIADDLFLIDLFQTCSRPIFVWFPQSSLKSLTLTKLSDIYTKLGVRTLSESAQKSISDVNHAGFEPVNIIKKGLLKLILAFLANPNFKIEVGKRHEAVSRLLAIEALETSEKMTIWYRLSLPSGDVVEVESRRMVRWDKKQGKLFTQKVDRSSGHKNVMEYAFHFAEEIAEGVLWDHEELVSELSELIRSGYSVEFDESAIDFLMKMKNMKIFVEDHEYLSSVFSSSSKGNPQEISWAGPNVGQQVTPKPNKRRLENDISSSYELPSTKSQKRTNTVSVTPTTIVILD